MPDMLPPDILHALASHGPVRLSVGEGATKKGLQCHVAPFEDCVFCFVEPGHPALRELLNSPRAEIQLSDEASELDLRIQGRAVQGQSVMANSRRSELLHWVPDGADPRRILTVHFWAEAAQFKKGESVFQGKTPLGRSRKEARSLWVDLAFGGLWPVVAFAFVSMWIWIAYAGNGEAVWQMYSLGVSMLSIWAIQVGSHLLYRAACFRRFLVGRCLPESCTMLSEGFLSHRSTVQTGMVLSVLGLAAGALLGAMDPYLLPVAATASLLWVLWPLWGIHLLQKTPEKTEDAGRSRR